MTFSNDKLPYRLCAGIMLLNAENKVFVAQRIDSTAEAWQMPQGGIDAGEDAYKAMLRELREETSVMTEHVELIGEYHEPLYYDLPEELIPKVWGGKYCGQQQYWFALRFKADDDVINIETDHPEFSEWRWVEPERLPEIIVPFKRELYEILAGWAKKIA